MTEWKYMNGLCLVAYWSVAVAFWAASGVPIAGCAQVVPPSRLGSLPMSSM